MDAKVTVIREAGQLRVPIGMARRMHGSLLLKHEPLPDGQRTIPVLRVLGDTKHVLYDPKVTYLCAGVIKFMGMEYVDRAWYVQEWACEVG